MEKIKSILLPLVGIAIIFSIPMSFIFEGVIESGIDSILHVKVDPRFSGGEEILRVTDPVGDENGPGSYEYPLSGMFADKGYLDIVRYVVNKPITNAPWSEDINFWQFAVTFDKTANADESVHSFSHPVIHVYIDIDGKEGGSTETVDPRAEKVRFDPEHPWDIMVQIDGHHMNGKLVSFDGKIKENVRVYFDGEKNTVYGRIPLDDPFIKRVLDGRKTWHYVLVGAYDHLSQGNFMPVKKEAALRNGGGAVSENAPNVYDCIVPKKMSQSAVLSSFNDKDMTFATIYPVEADSRSISSKPAVNEAEIARLEKILEDEKKSDDARKKTDLPGKLKTASAEEKVGLYFHAGEYEKAGIEADAVLRATPDNPIALAYKGSLLAMKGGKTKSVAEAMRYVNEGYALMDKAVALASNDNEKITARIARGSVSMSVPEAVFAKSSQGAADFAEAGALMSRIAGMRNSAGDLYINAGICLDNASKKDQAELMFLRAKQFTLSTYAKLNMIKRGIE